MKKVSVIGASGYTGAQLVSLIHQHPDMELVHTFVSENSQDAGKSMAQLHGSLAHLHQYKVQPINELVLKELSQTMDLVFLATPHEASHDWMPVLSSGNARVLDLSGAFRIKERDVFANHYGFEHTAAACLDQAVYGLAEWYSEAIAAAHIIAVPGCYPTASLSALKPLADASLLDTSVRPVINAVSGVSGAGRKASLTTSFYEVSLQAYGVLGHRHTPEIEAYLGTPVVFTPHLGNFKRGILATITVKTAAGTQQSDLNAAFRQAYGNSPIVRLRESFPKVDDVAHTPFVDLFWKLDEQSGYAVIASAIDNVMKGAASQAVQCANLLCGLPSEKGLIL
ncbi:N-acetyl-gamma-glutamyl-phosphate reductase [Alteromonas aestuariivivens]|uniref:N-acetyl-gamma-glutamyl-phosphate reductase n=1 Tax=Alteromonas aestuariivivens TaxID=1938339 RepID=A0A3D8MAG0_9ALTE|nr:N-acetyl-gamma-glutamyl-phosphate reductase [Alteromonas aestuariivivens]RDV26688.1 N-acetyl-gamma-glutamyl-phosphate reductase [Alteromonas aestuariivivens]